LVVCSFIFVFVIFFVVWGVLLCFFFFVGGGGGGGIKSMLAGCVFFPNSPQLIGYGKELCGILDANFNLLSDSESTQVSQVTHASKSSGLYIWLEMIPAPFVLRYFQDGRTGTGL